MSVTCFIFSFWVWYWEWLKVGRWEWWHFPYVLRFCFDETFLSMKYWCSNLEVSEAVVLKFIYEQPLTYIYIYTTVYWKQQNQRPIYQETDYWVSKTGVEILSSLKGFELKFTQPLPKIRTNNDPKTKTLISIEHREPIQFFFGLIKPKNIENKQKQRDPFTKKPRNTVWIRMAAHSCLITMKFLGGALITVAMAALKAREEESDALDANMWPLFMPSDELLHSLHFFLVLSSTLSWTTRTEIRETMKTRNKNRGTKKKKEFG